MSTLDAFHAAFFTLHRRFPSKQEIFDEGVREGKSRATPADHISQARDAERWRYCAEGLLFPEYCGHDAMTPYGDSWYMPSTEDPAPYRTANEAVDAAMKSAPPEKPAGDVSDI